MQLPYLTRLLAGAILVILVPGIACFGWYSTESVADANAATLTLVIVAYPVVLIALTFLVLTLASARRSRFKLWASAVSLLLAIVVLFIVRL
jgi:ACR3 family arsenite efflux pump ArsB